MQLTYVKTLLPFMKSSLKFAEKTSGSQNADDEIRSILQSVSEQISHGQQVLHDELETRLSEINTRLERIMRKTRCD
jgi:hypothetical protein